MVAWKPVTSQNPDLSIETWPQLGDLRKPHHAFVPQKERVEHAKEHKKEYNHTENQREWEHSMNENERHRGKNTRQKLRKSRWPRMRALRDAAQKQIEHYLSPESLLQDHWLSAKIEKTNGWALIETIVTFPRMKSLLVELQEDVQAPFLAKCASRSGFLQVDFEGLLVRSTMHHGYLSDQCYQRLPSNIQIESEKIVDIMEHSKAFDNTDMLNNSYIEPVSPQISEATLTMENLNISGETLFLFDEDLPNDATMEKVEVEFEFFDDKLDSLTLILPFFGEDALDDHSSFVYGELKQTTKTPLILTEDLLSLDSNMFTKKPMHISGNFEPKSLFKHALNTSRIKNNVKLQEVTPAMKRESTLNNISTIRVGWFMDTRAKTSSIGLKTQSYSFNRTSYDRELIAQSKSYKDMQPFRHHNYDLLKEPGFVQRKYTSFHDGAITDRQVRGISWGRKMDILYCFWVDFLGDFFIRNMYDEFLEVSCEDANSGFRFGLECLLEYYCHGLRKRFNAELFHDFQTVAEDDYYKRGHTFCMEKLYSFVQDSGEKFSDVKKSLKPDIKVLFKSEFKDLESFKGLNMQ